MHSFQFHLGDYYSHTSHLSLTEDLAYRRLIDFYYLHETPPTGRADQIARLIRMPKEVAAVEQVLNEFFCQEMSDSGDDSLIVWRHKRCDVEIQKFQSFKESGRKGAALRWAKSAYGEAIGGPSGGHENPNSNHKPVTNNQIKDKSARKRAVNKPDEVTDQTWEAFLVHRKSKRASVTDVVIDQIASEARKAGISLDSAMRLMCARGWTGFEADWLNKAQPANAWAEQKERANAAFRVMTGQQRSISGDVIDIEEDKNDPFRLSFGN